MRGEEVPGRRYVPTRALRKRSENRVVVVHFLGSKHLRNARRRLAVRCPLALAEGINIIPHFCCVASTKLPAI
jgi:hypothetical protein